MTSIGPGVREIRIRQTSGAYRVIYLATIGDAVHVLHAFQKKTQATARRDIDLARARLRTASAVGLNNSSLVWALFPEVSRKQGDNLHVSKDSWRCGPPRQ